MFKLILIDKNKDNIYNLYLDGKSYNTPFIHNIKNDKVNIEEFINKHNAMFIFQGTKLECDKFLNKQYPNVVKYYNTIELLESVPFKVL